MYLFLCIILIVALIILVITIRTIRFKPKSIIGVYSESFAIDTDKAAASLSEMIKCKTVSNVDKINEDSREFDRFRELLPSLFPRVYERCENIEVSDRAILIRCKGSTSENPAVFMAHYDVVPAVEEDWRYPAFSGQIAENSVWGRGALDTKSTLNAIMYALEELMADGFVPNRDIYLAFGSDEEINGHGASDIVDYFERNGIEPSFVLDEGGAVVRDIFPGVSKEAALVGIAEKGILNVEFCANSTGGHSSTPPAQNPIGLLSKTCVKILKKTFRMNISPAAMAMFDNLAPHSDLFYRIVFSNLWLFSPVLNYITKKSGGEMNALVRTTIAFTQMMGSRGMNVLPSEAKLIANIRINPGDTTETVIKHLEKCCSKDVSVKMLYGTDPSVISDIETTAFSDIKKCIEQTWKGVIVAPYLMVGCSDSRHWGRISNKVYRFSPIELIGDERGTIHAKNEHIPIPTIKKAVEFYFRILKLC